GLPIQGHGLGLLREELARFFHLAVDLAERPFVGPEVFLLAGQQVAARAGFGIAQRQLEREQRPLRLVEPVGQSVAGQIRAAAAHREPAGAEQDRATGDEGEQDLSFERQAFAHGSDRRPSAWLPARPIPFVESKLRTTYCARRELTLIFNV